NEYCNRRPVVCPRYQDQGKDHAYCEKATVGPASKEDGTGHFRLLSCAGRKASRDHARSVILALPLSPSNTGLSCERRSSLPCGARQLESIVSRPFAPGHSVDVSTAIPSPTAHSASLLVSNPEV